VSANSAVRHAFEEHAAKYGWTIHLPKLSFTTDNAAMVAIVGQYKLQDGDFCSFDAAPFARVTDKF
jgi:N6-L-threonylcarbamoyladenine synthase